MALRFADIDSAMHLSVIATGCSHRSTATNIAIATAARQGITLVSCHDADGVPAIDDDEATAA